MDVIAKTRELGKLLQADERYTAFAAAKKQNDADAALQDLIGRFNIERLNLSQLLNGENKSEEMTAEADRRLKAVYAEVMENENMKSFSAAKDDLDALVKDITNLLTLFVNGEDPDTCEIPHGCGGGCGGCGADCDSRQ